MGRLRRIVRVLALALTVLVIGVGAAWVFRVPLFGKFVEDAVTSALSAEFGGHYAIEGTGGSWLFDLELHGLSTVEIPDAGPVLELGADRIRLSYSLWGLARGDGLAALSRLEVEGLRVDLDPARAGPSRTPPDHAGPDFDVFRQTLPALQIAGQIRIATPSGFVTADQVLASSEHDELTMSVGAVVLTDGVRVPGSLSALVNRTADEIHWTSASSLGGLRIPRLRITRDGEIEGRAELPGGAVEATGHTGALLLDVSDFDVAKLPAWATPYLPEWPTRGRLSLAVRHGDADAGTRFQAHVADLVWRGESVDTLLVRGRWDGADELLIDEGQLASVIGTVDVREASVDFRLPYLLRRAQLVSADIPRVRALFPEAERDVRLQLRATSDGPDRLALEELRIEDDGLLVRVTGTADLPSDPAEWRKTALAGSFEATISDVAPFAIEWAGTVALTGTIDGTAELPSGTFRMAGRDLVIAGESVDRLEADGEIAWPDLRVRSFEAASDVASIEAEGRVTLDDVVAESGRVTLRVNDLGGLAKRFGLGDVRGAARLDGRIRHTNEGTTASASITTTDLSVATSPLTISGDLAFDGRTLDVTLAGDGASGHAHIVGSVEPGANRARVASFAFDGMDDTGCEGPRVRLTAPWSVTWDAGVTRLGRLEADIDGLQVTARGALGPAPGHGLLEAMRIAGDGFEASLEIPLALAWTNEQVALDDLALRVGDTRLRARATIDFEQAQATVATLAIDSPSGKGALRAPLVLRSEGAWIEIRGLDATILDARIRSEARVDLQARTARISQLAVDVEQLMATLNGPATVRFDDDAVVSDDLDVALFGGRIRGALRWAEGRLSGRLGASGVALGRMITGVPGTLEADLELDGERLALEARVPDLAWRRWRGDLTVTVTQDEEGPLRVDALRLDGTRGSAIVGHARLPWRIGSAGLVRLETVEPGLTLDGRIAGLDRLVDSLGSTLALQARGDATGVKLDLRVDDALSGEPATSVVREDVLAHVTMTREGVHADIGLASDQVVMLRGRAELGVGFDWWRPPTDLPAQIRTAPIDVALDANVRDWSPVLEAIPFITRLEGGARTRIRLGGTLEDPDVDASLALENVTIETRTNVNSFRDVNAQLTWRGDEVRIERFEGLMGYAPASVSGTVALPEADGYPIFDLVVRSQNALVIRSQYMRLRADLDARLRGPLDRLTASGSGVITDFLYREPLHLGTLGHTDAGDADLQLFSLTTWPFDQMLFDIDLRADESIRIRNNLLRVNLSADLHLGGTGAAPTPRGRISFTNGDVFLPLTLLRRTTGAIVFPPDEPYRPRLQMSAEARTRGYEVRVQLSGTLPDVDFVVLTEPYLDQDEAILLVATGSTAADLSGTGLATTAARAMVEVFGGGLFSSGGTRGEPGELAFLDRFYFVSEEGESYTGRQIMSAEAELSDRLFLRAERDHFEQTNLGVVWRLRFR